MLALKTEKLYQLFAGLIFNPQRFLQLLFIKSDGKPFLQFMREITQLLCQIFHRRSIISIRHVQKCKRHTLFLLQIPEGIQIPVTGKRRGNRVVRHRYCIAVNGSYKRQDRHSMDSVFNPKQRISSQGEKIFPHT